MQKNLGNDLVFTTVITLRNGKKLYANQCGKKAFCFPRRPRKNKKD